MGDVTQKHKYCVIFLCHGINITSDAPDLMPPSESLGVKSNNKLKLGLYVVCV